MNIKIRLFATLKKHIKENDQGTCTLEISEGARVSEALNSLNIPIDTPKILLVNGKQTKPEGTLQDGDMLSIFPPIIGG